MKTAKSFNGLAVSKSLYNFDEDVKTDSKISHSTDLNNLLHPRPSLLPGKVQLQNTREEKIADSGYQQGFEDAKRIYNDVDLYGLNLLRDEMEQKRKAILKRERRLK